jgi:hypothetical protein
VHDVRLIGPGLPEFVGHAQALALLAGHVVPEHLDVSVPFSP